MQLCLAAIRNQYEMLTRIERQIADYILNNCGQVLEMNVAEVAAAAGTAGSAVIRFCKKLGYTGFSQFRMALARELAVYPSVPSAPPRTGESLSEVAQKVFMSGIRTMQNTAAMMEQSQLEQLVSMLAQAERICVFGVGTSASIAEDSQYRFLQLGYPSSCYTDILFMSVAAMNMKKGEVAIGISHSGRTEATLEAVRLAKEQGARTVAITSYQASPLAQMADYKLVAYADDITYPVEAVSARLAHLCLMDVLTVALALQGGTETTERLASKNRILEHIRRKEES